MPAVSKRQWRFLNAIKHGWQPKGKKGPSKKAATEYISSQKSPKGLPETKKTAINFDNSDQAEIEKLTKAYERSIDGTTLVDPREFYGALQAVNKRTLEWLSNVVKGMKANDLRDIPMFVDEGTIKIRKIASDMYSGWVLDKTGDINHEFDRLTIPALATQIMSLYELYQPEENEHDKMPALRSLHSEIETLNTELKNAKNKSTVKDVEKRLEGIITSIEKLTAEHEEMKQQHVNHTLNVSNIEQKLHELKTKVDEHQMPVISETPPVPDKIEAHQMGEPGVCPDCGKNPCLCFTHLPRPTVEILPSGKVSIFFKSEWSDLDKTTFLKSMKYIVSKKRGRKDS